MISNKYQCLFVHIPKTAGRSIESFFLNLHGLEWKDRSQLLLRPNSDPNQGPERLAHLTASEYVSCGHIGQSTFNSLFKFSIVRNPWDRIVSEYHFQDYDQSMTFEEFVTRGLPSENNYTDSYRHILPQYDYLYSDTNKCLVDFIGKFENLEADFKTICSRLSIPQSKLPHMPPLPRFHILKSHLSKLSPTSKNKRHYSDYYCTNTQDIIANLYAKDIETFGYQFGA